MIDRNLSIDGGNRVTLDGMENGRLFHVSAGMVSLANMILTRGREFSDGGAVLVGSANFTIDGVTFLFNDPSQLLFTPPVWPARQESAHPMTAPKGPVLRPGDRRAAGQATPAIYACGGAGGE